jgi:uncharacterized protein RhaS with RHS repeats
MALKQELMASSAPAALANKLGLDQTATVAAAGTTQVTATDLASNCWNVNSGTGGVQINSGDQIQFGVNSTGAAITVYPPAGGTINGGAANAGISLPQGKSIFLIPNGTNLMAIVSA